MSPSSDASHRIKALEQQLEFEAVTERSIRQLREAEIRARDDESGLMAELHSLGYIVPSIHALMHSAIDYSPALPSIISWLPRVKLCGVREMLVRSLATPKYWRIVAPALLDGFVAPWADDGTVRWAVGNSIETIANDNLFEGVADLLVDKRFGEDRTMLALAMGKMKKRRADAIQVLLPLLDDPTIEGHVLSALKKLKAVEAEPYLERFLHHKHRWVRREAEKLRTIIADAKRASGG
jgi:hypothetical protein